MILRLIACCLWLLVPALAWAADDNFGAATKIDTEHFTIFYKPGVDINNLISQLHVSQTDQINDQSENQYIIPSGPIVKHGRGAFCQG